MANNLNWDLESIFAGGSNSAGLARFIEQLEADLTRAEGSPLPPRLEPSTHPAWGEAVRTLDDLGARLAQARSFVGCLEARDVGDERARVVSADLMTFSARLESLWTRLNALAADQPDPRWLELVATPDLVPSAFALTEGRTLARRKMPPDMETIVNDLAGDGYHAWGQLYNTAAGLRQVEVDMDGTRARQSLGQLQNTFTGHPDRRVRRLAYEAYTAAWQDLAPIAAMALNHQAGFRLNLYRHRGWRSVLEEPLFNNRLQRATVDTMWRVTADRAPRMLPFFEAKARIMGIDRLAWYDVTAPVGGLAGTMGFAEAGDFVVDSIRSVNPDIADFCRMALEKRWVEAEDRPGKRAGAFCTGLPLTGESRVFMTFSGSYAGLATLAHDWGTAITAGCSRTFPTAPGTTPWVWPKRPARSTNGLSPTQA